MTPKTIFEKNGQTVVLSECCVIINGKLKCFCIEETKQYFSIEKRAIRAARDLLLKKSLPKFKYRERKRAERKRNRAHRIARTHKCYVETQAYVTRWNGELYLDTKRSLLKELSEKLKKMCVDYDFESPECAIEYLERSKK